MHIPEDRNRGVEANARITGYTGLVLLVPLVIAWLTGLLIRGLLVPHVLVGFLVVPPVLLKLASVGYRFGRYYTRDPCYRAAGPPRLALRLLGPVEVLLTVVVFVSGIELWLFGYGFGFWWLPVHHASAYLWFVAIAIHVAYHLRRAPELALADWRDHLRGAFTRRALVAASLLLGVALAVAMLPFPSPFTFREAAGGG